MKKYLVFILVLSMCFSFILPAGAQTLSAEKQTLIKKMNLELTQLNTQLSQTATGSVEYKIDQLDGGFLMMVPELAGIQGSKLGFDYKINTPAKQLALHWNLTYNGKDYQGEVYLEGSKFIFSKDILQLMNEIAPTGDMPDPAALPKYLYVEEPELANLWSTALVSSQFNKMIPQLNDLLVFFVEAIPDSCLSVSGDKITLRLDQKLLGEVVASVLQKVQKEPERFAAGLARVITTIDSSETYDKVNTEILSDIQESIKNGTFPSAEEFNQFFSEIGLELESLSFVTSKDMNGASSLIIKVNLKNEAVTQGQLTVNFDQNRSGDRVDGKINMDIKAAVKEENMEVGASITGNFDQTKTTAASDLLLKVNAAQNAMPLFNLGLKMLSKAEADPNLLIKMPVLTSENSVNFNALMEEEKSRQKSLAIFPGMEQRISVVLNGRPVKFDVQPYVKDGRTMVPVRNLAESLGCRVTLINGNQIHITKGDKFLMMKIGERRYTVNGVAKILDVPAYVKNGRTMVPIRFVAEEMGCTVKAAGDTVYINTNGLLF